MRRTRVAVAGLGNLGTRCAEAVGGSCDLVLSAVVRRTRERKETAHPHLLLEARFEEHRVAADVMLAALRALPFLEPGAASLFDVPPGALFGKAAAEREWM